MVLKKIKCSFGFTIIEVTIVVVIISLITIVAIRNYARSEYKARLLQASNVSHNIQKQIEFYLENNLTWPDDQDFTPKLSAQEKERIYSAKYVKGNDNISSIIPEVGEVSKIKGYTEISLSDGVKLYSVAVGSEDQSYVWVRYVVQSNQTTANNSTSYNLSSGNPSTTTDPGATTGETVASGSSSTSAGTTDNTGSIDPNSPNINSSNIDNTQQTPIICPESQYIYNNTCVSSCPVGQYIYNNTCVSSCPVGQYIYNNQCVGSCPFGSFLLRIDCAICNDPLYETPDNYWLPTWRDHCGRYSDNISRTCAPCVASNGGNYFCGCVFDNWQGSKNRYISFMAIKDTNCANLCQFWSGGKFVVGAFC